MGKQQSRFLQQLLAGQMPPLPSQLNRWLSAVTIATMMALSTVVVAAEFPQQPRQKLTFEAIEPASRTASGATHKRQESAPRISQRIRRKDIWQEVQKRLPDLPLENTYISSITGDINETSTLIRRMIEYHNFRKGRSPRSRFDWKLTLADYLGLYDVIVAETYPGNNKLKTNPMAGDMAAIQAMNREQRNQLINTLVSLYDPRIPAAFFSPAAPSPTIQPEPSKPSEPAVNPAPSQPSPPPLAEPGAADLLRPRS